MKDEEVLRKAFKKAKDNGWDKGCYDAVLSHMKTMYAIYREPPILSAYFRGVLVSHGFARAFFGLHMVGGGLAGEIDQENPAWEFHLQEMVLEPEPLKYIAKFLEEDTDGRTKTINTA